jgi:hypothetical protein
MMITQKLKVHLGKPIDGLNQTFIVADPLPGVPKLGGSQEDCLGLVLIAMGEVIIRAMKLWAFQIMATAIKVAAPVSMLPDGPA